MVGKSGQNDALYGGYSRAVSEMEIDSSKPYAVSVSWENFNEIIDVDLQAVIVDQNGLIVDAVYYNNLMSMKGAISSSGEDVQDAGTSSETIWVNFKRLPAQICLIIFIVAAHTEESHLSDVNNGVVKLIKHSRGCIVHKFKMETTVADVDVVGLMENTSGRWRFKQVDLLAESGSHFLDIVEPTIGDLIRGYLPKAPRKQTVAFSMQKGAVIDLPTTQSIRRVNVGIGGSAKSQCADHVDLDVAAVIFSKRGKVLGAVTGDHTKSKYGICHTGDRDLGEALSGDDEAITVDLLSIPSQVGQIFFVLHVFTPGATFALVEDAYCRITDQACAELASFDISGGARETGLIISRLFRPPGGSERWGFQALGRFCHGPTWKEAEKELKAIFNDTPHEVEYGGGLKMPFQSRLSQVNKMDVVAEDRESLEMDPLAVRLANALQQARQLEQQRAQQQESQTTPQQSNHTSPQNQANGTKQEHVDQNGSAPRKDEGRGAPKKDFLVAFERGVTPPSSKRQDASVASAGFTIFGGSEGSSSIDDAEMMATLSTSLKGRRRIRPSKQSTPSEAPEKAQKDDDTVSKGLECLEYDPSLAITRQTSAAICSSSVSLSRPNEPLSPVSQPSEFAESSSSKEWRSGGVVRQSSVRIRRRAGSAIAKVTQPSADDQKARNESDRIRENSSSNMSPREMQYQHEVAKHRHLTREEALVNDDSAEFDRGTACNTTCYWCATQPLA